MKILQPLIGFLLALGATAHTASYEVLATAAAEAGVTTLTVGKYYAMYEYWAATNWLTDCIAGYSHVRLVVGKVTYVPNTNHQEMDYVANAWHMISAGTNAAGYLAQPLHWPKGGEVQAEYDTWYPNQYYNYQTQQWVSISRQNTYVWAGEVTTKTRTNSINAAAKRLAEENKSYNLATNNCNIFAARLYNAIR